MLLQSVYYPHWYPFNEFFPDATCTLVDDPKQVKPEGWLILWGGEDIHPQLYNHKVKGSNVGNRPSHRDLAELACFREAVLKRVPIIGVCRGAQMGCIGSGGTLIQDVSGHLGGHLMETHDGKKMTTSSLHHQMMYPSNKVDHEIIAWSLPHLSKRYRYDSEERITDYIEPEIIWFPKTKCLATQGHPEYHEVTTPYNRYIEELMHKYGR